MEPTKAQMIAHEAYKDGLSTAIHLMEESASDVCVTHTGFTARKVLNAVALTIKEMINELADERYPPCLP
jgi:hypothetical protein